MGIKGVDVGQECAHHCRDPRAHVLGGQAGKMPAGGKTEVVGSCRTSQKHGHAKLPTKESNGVGSHDLPT